MQGEYTTNRVTIIHQQHRKVSRYSGSFIFKKTISSVKNSHQVSYFFTSKVSPNHNSIQQASYLLSISEQYTAQYSTSLIYFINFRAIYSPVFNKPLIFYQFHSNIQPRIKQASDLLSISKKYTAHHSTSLWYSINFRAIYSPKIKYSSKFLHSLMKNSKPCCISWISSIQNKKQ